MRTPARGAIASAPRIVRKTSVTVALQIGYEAPPSHAGKWLKNKVVVGFLNRSERGKLR